MPPRLELDLPGVGERLPGLLAHHGSGRYCEDRSLPLAASRQLVVDLALKALAREDVHSLTASDGDSMQGLLLFRRSAWDSEHFGYPVAIVDSLWVEKRGYDERVEIARELLGGFEEWCRTERIHFVTAKLPALELPLIHAFEDLGFRFIESWICNKFEVEKRRRLPGTPRELRLARPDDRSVMIRYAEGAFSTHRFHADGHIPIAKAESLYRKWIETAFGDPGQDILTLDGDRGPAAFMIFYHYDLRPYFGKQFAMWKMAVIDPEIRGLGVGTEFFTSLVHRHHEDGMDVVDSGLSARNLASLNLHNKLDFTVVSLLVTLHRWFE